MTNRKCVFDQIREKRNEWVSEVSLVFNSSKNYARLSLFSDSFHLSLDKTDTDHYKANCVVDGNNARITVLQGPFQDAEHAKIESDFVYSEMRNFVLTNIAECDNLQGALSATSSKNELNSMYILFFKDHVKYVQVRAGLNEAGDRYRNTMLIDKIVGPACSMYTLDQNMRGASDIQEWKSVFGSDSVSIEQLEKMFQKFRPWQHRHDTAAAAVTDTTATATSTTGQHICSCCGKYMSPY